MAIVQLKEENTQLTFESNEAYLAANNYITVCATLNEGQLAHGCFMIEKLRYFKNINDLTMKLSAICINTKFINDVCRTFCLIQLILHMNKIWMKTYIPFDPFYF